ncbi:hypothetical protein [Clostridium beijerinckii]|uniref:hypothetical protein n=1 Tax=Clostridium beijerinckii TaxID=1520 RepID=UPI0005A31A89|nr:hypothetical protein [Clostridium beijerinckii]
MKKSNKKESSEKPEVNITDIIKDWTQNSEIFKTMVPNMSFNDLLLYCIEKFTILPK